MMPPATAIEHNARAATAVPFNGANRPKLANTTASQKMRRTRNGVGMLLLSC